MKSSEFCYWLQGYFEINGESGKGLTPLQAERVRRHLALVFIHELDDQADGGDVEVKAALQAIHDGAQKPAKPPIKHSGDSEKTYRC